MQRNNPEYQSQCCRYVVKARKQNYATFGSASTALDSLVVLRTRACNANRANTTSALIIRISCNHLTTTYDHVSDCCTCRVDYTHSLIACDSRIGSVVALQVLWQEIASCHFSCAFLVGVELAGHHQCFRLAAEGVVALLRVVQHKGSESCSGAGSCQDDDCEDPKATFALRHG
jgi:hypothetical protein